MSSGLRLNRRFSQLAVGRHLSYRAVRVRLTLLYGGLFLLSGAALMAIAYALLVNAGFVFTLQNGTGPAPVPTRPTQPAQSAGAPLPTPGARTHPAAQTLTHWRAVARCMRQHGLSGFPNPTTSVPARSALGGGLVLSDKDGALFALPGTIQQSPQYESAAVACGYVDRHQAQLWAQEARRRADVRQRLLIESGIALAGMSLLSLGLGWLMAGRVLQPLQDAYEAQRQFVANASHELRAPLTRQRTLIEVALANPDADLASLRTTAERVLAAEQHLEQIIDGLLALARGQAGVQRHENVDLATLTSQAVHAREPRLQDLGLEIRPALTSAPTTGDPTLIERLIANLLDNAICHNTPGGRVEITTGTRDRDAFVSISNTGPAIPPDQVQRLFEPFQRLGTARTHHQNGHGLGLAIVKAIADAHGADLSVQTPAEGGLTVVVSFPAAAQRGMSTLPSGSDRLGREVAYDPARLHEG